MAGHRRRIGPSLTQVIEEGHPISLKIFLEQTDTNFAMVASLSSAVTFEGEIKYQDRLSAALQTLSPEQLEPVETECQRVLLLTDGKGHASCPPVLQRHLTDEDYEVWEGQVDHLARALWLHVLHRSAFDDAVAYCNAREWRRAERFFTALEIQLDEATPFSSSEVPEIALLTAIQLKLKLSQKCGVNIFDLPKNSEHPASVMLIIRHAGRLASVAEHPEDAGRQLHYYLPQDEVVLIYTPSLQRIEVCGQSSEVRRVVSDSFAQVALEHDVSKKPLTWANYDTSRFFDSLELDAPDLPGFFIERAGLTELELRLGNWNRRINFKVPFRDDMANFVDESLGRARALRRAIGISRVEISVKFRKTSETKDELLQFTISDRNRCNLSGVGDGAVRDLGRALLAHWGIVQPFRDIAKEEVAATLPVLAEIFDLGTDTISARFVEERGGDPRRLVEAGLLIRKGCEPVLIEDFDPDMDQSSPESSAIYQVKVEWLEEKLINLLQDPIDHRSRVQFGKDLIKIGSLSIDNQIVPCFLARGLTDVERYIELDGKLRLTSDKTPGIVFVGKDPGWRNLGPHVVIPILKNSDLPHTSLALSRNEIEAAFRSGLDAALGATVVKLEELPGGHLSLTIPGYPPLAIDGEHQKKCVRLLVMAFNSGVEGVETSRLIEGTGSGSVGQMFGKRWSTISGSYIRNVRRKMWALNAR